MKPSETFPSQKIINGQWGYCYDPDKKMMLGGYSADGMTFTHTFTVTGLAKDDVMFAVALCGLMYGKNRKPDDPDDAEDEDPVILPDIFDSLFEAHLRQFRSFFVPPFPE